MFTVFMVLISAFTIGTLIWVCIVGYLLFWPVNPINIERLDIDHTEADVGDEIGIHMVGEKLMPLPVKVKIDLVNGSGIDVETYESNVAVGNKFNWHYFTIPLHLKTHSYQVRWTGTYVVNKYRIPIVKEVRSKPIYIINNRKHINKGDTGK
jgi:hypothetical protein